jgi:hypothetical protein
MKIATLATLVLGLGLSGCQMIARDYYYRIIVVNLSQEKITENRIFDSSGEYNYGCGTSVPSGYASNAGPMETIPNDEFTVSWKDAQGQAHEQKFDLRKRVKRNFKGEIVFVYKADKIFGVEIVNPPDRYPIPHQRQGYDPE